MCVWIRIFEAFKITGLQTLSLSAANIIDAEGCENTKSDTYHQQGRIIRSCTGSPIYLSYPMGRTLIGGCIDCVANQSGGITSTHIKGLF